jgi:hypothetical protein
MRKPHSIREIWQCGILEGLLDTPPLSFILARQYRVKIHIEKYPGVLPAVFLLQTQRNRFRGEFWTLLTTLLSVSCEWVLNLALAQSRM